MSDAAEIEESPLGGTLEKYQEAAGGDEESGDYTERAALFAAEEFSSAVKGGDPKEILKAMRRLKELA